MFKEEKANRIRRVAVSVMLIALLSFGAVGTMSMETYAAKSGTKVQASDSSGSVVKKGKNYYYKKANGKLRKKKGFISCAGNRYYIKKGGKIAKGKTIKVGKYKYRAFKNGVIATGVYKWSGKYNFSDASGHWIKKEGIVYFGGNSFHLNKKGVVSMNKVFSYQNVPYRADAGGRLTLIPIPDGGGNPVVAVAKNQVGIMTGKTYWRWYFGTTFRDTDRTPWCGAFVAWCYNAAGWYDKVTAARSFGNLGYVPSYSKYADANGKWVNQARALPGDIIVFGKNRHVGLVEGISDGCIVTIEGNAGPTAVIGCGKAGAVVRNVYAIGDRDIKGVIHVD